MSKFEIETGIVITKDVLKVKAEVGEILFIPAWLFLSVFKRSDWGSFTEWVSGAWWVKYHRAYANFSMPDMELLITGCRLFVEGWIWIIPLHYTQISYVPHRTKNHIGNTTNLPLCTKLPILISLGAY